MATILQRTRSIVRKVKEPIKVTTKPALNAFPKVTKLKQQRKKISCKVTSAAQTSRLVH